MTTTIHEPIFNLDDVLQITNDRHKEDYLKIAPNNFGGIDKAGDTRFEVNNQQYFLNMFESFLVAEFSITKGDGTALGKDDITLENNFFMRQYCSTRIEVGGGEVEHVAQAPGEASTIANFVMSSESYKRANGQISGWIPDTNKGDNDVTDIDYNAGYFHRKKIYKDKMKFKIIFPLKYLFGFMEYNKILYLIKITLILNRRDDDLNKDIFYGAATTPAKIKLENIFWWIPYIEPSLEIAEMIRRD